MASGYARGSKIITTWSTARAALTVTASNTWRSITNTRCHRGSRRMSEKSETAVSMMVYGTPQVQALNQKLTEDKIPGTSPGFGIAASADGKRYPYLFPVAATYWSQGAAAIQFVK